MIRALCLNVCLMAGLTSPASAQATVKAGEHSDFSRIVVYFPETQSWTFEKTEEGYRISLKNWDAGFDTTTVFDLIPRTRIASLNAQSSTLELELACQCEAIAEELESGGAIIDVKAIELADVASVQDENDVLTIPLQVGRQQRELISTVFSEPEENPVQRPELEAFRKSLLENLGRSASLSLVELDTRREAPNENASPSVAQEPTVSGEGQAFAETGRLRITSAMEAAISDKRLEPSAKVEMTCPNPDGFEIAQWSYETPFRDSIGKLRKEILSEFDEPNAVAIRSLVQFYLHYGLGVEAKAVMEQFNFPSSERASLTALADILEPPLFGDGNTLHELIHCDANIAIWAMLTPDGKKSLDPSKTKSIVSEFAAWPVHLRLLVGPKLVSALTENGETSAAAVVSSIIERPSGKVSSELTMVSARASDHQAYSVSDLLSIVNDGGDDAPEALKFYLLRMMADDRQIDPSLLELASAYAKELAGLPVGQSLGNLNVLALAYSGQFSEALNALRNAEVGGWAPKPRTADRLSTYFGESADSDDLARLMFALQSNGDLGNLDPEITDALVLRFVSDGVPELAKFLLHETSRQTVSPSLAADLARALGRPDEAISILRSAPGHENDPALAELMLIGGQAKELWQEMKDNLPPALRDQAAWSASQWDVVESQGPRRTIAQLMTRVPEVELDNSPLATAAALRESSESARNAIAELLRLNSS